MARRARAAALNVYAQQRLMGTLTSRADSQLEFRYAHDWLSDINAFPLSLSMPLSEKLYKTSSLQPVLDNMLPDDQGVRDAIAARVGARGTDPFSLLWELGRECVGALQFLPAHEDVNWSAGVQGEELDDERIETLLTTLRTAPLGLGRDTAFRISIAGAQEKTALCKVGDRWLLPTGTTPSTHILKPAIGKVAGVDLSNSVENEYVCMCLAAEIGLPTAEVRIERFEDVITLVVRRFDRVWFEDALIRLPQEDLCQALSVPSFRKYEADGGPGMADVFELLLQSDAPEDDQKQFFQSCFAFWLLGATDGHAKNFSLSLRAQGGFRLTPLYDVMSLQPSVDAFEVNRRDFRAAMAVGTNRHYRMDEIVPRHFIQSAVAGGISNERAEQWLEEVAHKVPDAVNRVRESLDGAVQDEILESIGNAAIARAELAKGF